MKSFSCLSLLLLVAFMEARISDYGGYQTGPPAAYRSAYQSYGYRYPSYSNYNAYYRQPTVYQPQAYYYRQPTNNYSYNYYQYPQYSAYNRYPSYAGYYSQPAQPATTSYMGFGRKSGHSDRYGGNAGYSYGCIGPCKGGLFGLFG